MFGRILNALILTMLFLGLSASGTLAEPVVWDTVATSQAWDTGVPTGNGENIALSVANNGEMGQLGIGGVNLDFSFDGGETGIRQADRVYLRSGSLFLMRNDGDSVLLTTSIAQRDWTSAAAYDSISYDFLPVPGGGPMSSGIYNDGDEDVYDSVFIGRLASRDTSVYVERTFYAPRYVNAFSSRFLIVRTKLFTGNKGDQTGLSVGDVMDWDVPSDRPSLNTSQTSIAADVAYLQGTVDQDSSFTWDNSQRFAAGAMMGWATSGDLAGNACAEERDHHGSLGTLRTMMEDSLIAPGVHEPDAQMWWDSATSYDYNSGNLSETDQAVWMTYLHDFDLADSDTLYFWTALATVKQGTVADLEASVAAAHSWYFEGLRDCDYGCCIPPTVGDLNQDGVVDITDIATEIDFLFISLCPLACEEEGDCDYSGVVDITDLSIQIDNQFLTLTPLGPCP